MRRASGRRARLAVSIGCPCGIGPEVSVVAAARSPARVLLVGDLGAVRAAARARRIDVPIVLTRDPREAFEGPRREAAIWVHQPAVPLSALERKPGSATRAAGAAQLRWIDVATDLVSGGIADALVTGPVSKEAIARSGARGAREFIGHTEHLASRLRAPEVTMAFWSKHLTTSLVTTHLPLARVPRAITEATVARAAYWTARFVAQLGGGDRPIAVAALNPHAGEAGLFGHEERRAIGPGIVRARERIARDGLRVPLEGPVPAESAFRLAASGRYSAVVAMYHDQATIPMKLLGFGEAVNVSLGLPIVRTSVDHGTAYDRAGKGTAEARGMVEAMALAGRLCARRERSPATGAREKVARRSGAR